MLDNLMIKQLGKAQVPQAMELVWQVGFEATKPEQLDNGIRYTPMKRVI